MTSPELIRSVNPATEEVISTFEPHSPIRIEEALRQAAAAYRSWRRTSFAERAKLLQAAAVYLRTQVSRLAGIMTAEMGKPIVESEAEVAKCAWNCEYYAENAEGFLRDEPRRSSATESYTQYTPLGTILAIMPWNFPFWQVFRFAAPALMAGDTAILKHASNVPQCAMAIEEVFREVGFPPGTFSSLLISSSAVPSLIDDPRIAAVTLTGSEGAGGAVASQAGSVCKKTVLELGGSDPYVILADADIESAARVCVRSRYQNSGQSCIAAKRFIVVEPVYHRFLERFVELARELKVGDPLDRATQVGPLARRDLLDDLARQVEQSVARGAELSLGGKRRAGRGYFFEPTVLSGVPSDAPASCEEVFGPVAAIIRARDAEEAVRIANSSPYGLGSGIWTADLPLARRLARDMEAGQVFINGMVASDPRLPFGGVKRSGYGRELSELGIREFVNVQTVWIGPPA